MTERLVRVLIAHNIYVSRGAALEDPTIDVHEDDRPLPDPATRHDDIDAGDHDS